MIALRTARPHPTLGAALRLVPLIVLQGLVSAYVAAATLAPLAVLTAARLLRPSTRRAGAYLGMALALAAAILSLAFAGHAVVRAENPSWAHAASLATLGRPVTHLPWGPFRPPSAAAIAPPVLGLIAAGVITRLLPIGSARLDRAAWWPGLVWAGVGLAIALTPHAELAGGRVVLPHAALATWTPLYEVLRVPARLGMAALVGLALLAAAALAECARRAGLGVRGSAVLAALIVAAMYASYLRGVLVPPLIFHTPLPGAYPLQRPGGTDDPLLPLLARPGGPLLSSSR